MFLLFKLCSKLDFCNCSFQKSPAETNPQDGALIWDLETSSLVFTESHVGKLTVSLFLFMSRFSNFLISALKPSVSPESLASTSIR